MDIFCSVHAALQLPGSLVYCMITLPRGAQVEKTAIPALSGFSTKGLCLRFQTRTMILNRVAGQTSIICLQRAGDVSSLLMWCGQSWVPEQARLASTNWWNDARGRYFTQKAKIHPAQTLQDRVQIHYSSPQSALHYQIHIITMLHYHSE